MWDIKNNAVLSISKDFQTKLPVSKIVDYTIWYEKPYLYLYDKNSDKIDSLMFTAKLLTKTDKKIYELKKLNKNTLLSIVILFLILIGFITGLYYYIRKRKKTVTNIEQVELKSAIGTNSLFTEIEKTLLDLIISNIKDSNQLTSIDEVNYILGISNKTINMQKRTRSDIISSINSKYQIYFKTDAPLILRQNSEIDQRVKEFYIEADNINKITSLT